MPLLKHSAQKIENVLASCQENKRKLSRKRRKSWPMPCPRYNLSSTNQEHIKSLPLQSIYNFLYMPIKAYVGMRVFLLE